MVSCAHRVLVLAVALTFTASNNLAVAGTGTDGAGADNERSSLMEMASLQVQQQLTLHGERVYELYRDAPLELKRELESQGIRQSLSLSLSEGGGDGGLGADGLGLGGIAFDIERMVNASKEYIAAGEFSEGLKPDPGHRFYEDHPVFNWTDARASEYVGSPPP